MMMFKVRQWFEEAVRLHPTASSELKQTLLRGHPNLDEFLRKITVQLNQAYLILLKKGTIIKPKTQQDFVYDLTNYFILGMEGEAKRRYESDLARSAREAEAAKLQEFESVLEGNAIGEFAEAGVINDKELEEQRQSYLEARDKKIQSTKAK